MAPAGAVVPQPVGGVTLDAGRTGPGKYESAAIRHRGAQPLHRPHRHEQGVFVVKTGVGKPAVPEEHPLGRHIPRGRLVHVVPDAGDSGTDMLGVQPPPPRPGLRQREIGKDRPARPNLAHIRTALGVQTHQPVPQGIVIHRVAGLLLDPRVNDGDELEFFLGQIFHQARRIREFFPVPCEDTESVHVINVDPENVAGQPLAAVAGCQGFHLVLTVVVPTALVISEGPQRGQRHPTGQSRVAPQDLGRPGAGKDVLGVRAALEMKNRFLRPAKIKVGTAGIIQKEPGHLAVLRPAVQEKGDGDVIGIKLRAGRILRGIRMGNFPVPARHVGIEDVGVPEGPVAPVLVERPGFLPQSVDSVPPADPPPHLEPVPPDPVEPGSPLCIAGARQNGGAVGAPDFHVKRIAVQGNGDRPGDQLHPVRLLTDLDGRGFRKGTFRQHRVRGVLLPNPVFGDPDPHHLGAQNRHLHDFPGNRLQAHLQSMGNPSPTGGTPSASGHDCPLVLGRILHGRKEPCPFHACAIAGNATLIALSFGRDFIGSRRTSSHTRVIRKTCPRRPPHNGTHQPARYRSASIAAMHPIPAAVIA